MPGDIRQNEYIGSDYLIQFYKDVQTLNGNSLEFLPRYVCKDNIYSALHWYSHARLPTGLNYMNRGVTFCKTENNLLVEMILIIDTEIQSAAYLSNDLKKADSLIHTLYSYAWEPARKKYE